MYLNRKRFVGAAMAAVFSGAIVLGAVPAANAEPGKADPNGPKNCDVNPDPSVVTPSKPCKGNNGFGNGGGDGTPNGKQDNTR